jgi:hypothetical protein
MTNDIVIIGRGGKKKYIVVKKKIAVLEVKKKR